jgi:hypothetical protein
MAMIQNQNPSSKKETDICAGTAFFLTYEKTCQEQNAHSIVLSGGSGAQIAGTVKADLRFSLASGSGAAESIKRSLAGNASVDLNRCEVRKSKITCAIALFTGIKEIANPRFDKANFIFSIGNQKADLKGLMSSALLNLDPAGTVGFEDRRYNRPQGCSLGLFKGLFGK